MDVHNLVELQNGQQAEFLTIVATRYWLQRLFIENHSAFVEYIAQCKDPEYKMRENAEEALCTINPRFFLPPPALVRGRNNVVLSLVVGEGLALRLIANPIANRFQETYNLRSALHDYGETCDKNYTQVMVDQWFQDQDRVNRPQASPFNVLLGYIRVFRQFIHTPPNPNTQNSQSSTNQQARP
jgi:hypothetical protein